MNRQMRRATERSEKRQEKNPIRTPRPSRTTQPKAKARKASKSGGKSGDKPSQASAPPRQMPNWLMGSLALFAFVFVVLPQGLPPAVSVNQTSALYYASHAAAFAIFPYFLCTWLIRRGTANAVVITALMVAPLAVGVEVSKFMQLNQDLWRSAIFLPLALAGAAAGIWLADAVEKARQKMAEEA